MGLENLSKKDIELGDQRFVTTQFAAYRSYELLDKMARLGFDPNGGSSALPPITLVLELLAGTQLEVVDSKGKTVMKQLGDRQSFDQVFSGPGGLKRAIKLVQHVCEVNFADFQEGPEEAGPSDEATLE